MLHALGVRDRRPSTPRVMVNEAERAAARMKVFDTICSKHGYTPELIPKLPAERLAELIGAEGFPVMATSFLAGWVEEYLAAKRNGHRN